MGTSRPSSIPSIRWTADRIARRYLIVFAFMAILAAVWAHTHDFERAHEGLNVTRAMRWRILVLTPITPAFLLIPGSGFGIVGGLIAFVPLLMMAAGVVWRRWLACRIVGYAGIVLWFLLGAAISSALL